MTLIMKNLLALSLLLPLIAVANTKVIYNANGYTPTYKGELTQFSTLVIKDGKVVKVGTDELTNSFPDAQKFDAKQKTLLPGLIDAHGHVIGLVRIYLNWIYVVANRLKVFKPS